MSELNAVRKSETDADAWLSALYDGELEGGDIKRAIARLGQDANAERLWSEYSLIGDALRGCRVERSDLASRISAALAEEPTVLAPMPAKPEAGRQYYWVAAAAAVAAIAWSVLSLSPTVSQQPSLPVAANDATGAVASADEVRAYLAAHQDYAYAVVGEPEMQFTKVSLAGENR